LYGILLKRKIETLLLAIVLLASAFIVTIPVAQALTEGTLLITQDGTATLSRDASGFSKGDHELSIEISSDYSYDDGKVTLDKDSFSGTLAIDDDEFDLKNLKITVAKDLKSITYSGRLSGTGTVSGTLKFGAAIPFEEPGSEDATAGANSLKAKVGRASFDTKKTSTGSVEVDTNTGFESIDASFSEELALVLTDNEMNLDSETPDAILGSVFVEVDSAGGDIETLDMTETEDDSGQFVPDLPDGKLEVTFLPDSISPEENNGILELRAGDIGGGIVATYEVDGEDVDQITLGLTVTPGELSLPNYASIDDLFVLTIKDPDLNDDADAIDSYSFTLEGDLGEYPLLIEGDEISDLASIAMEINGETPNFAEELAITLFETDDNTGIFEAEIDMFELASVISDTEIAQDDEITFTYIDRMGDTVVESSADTTVADILWLFIYQDGYNSSYDVYLEIEATYIYSDPITIDMDSVVAVLDIIGEVDDYSYEPTITSITIADDKKSISYSGYIDSTKNAIQGTLKFESALDFSSESAGDVSLDEGKNALKFNIGKKKFDLKKTTVGEIDIQ
jgi:hypothetical protein